MNLSSQVLPGNKRKTSTQSPENELKRAIKEHEVSVNTQLEMEAINAEIKKCKKVGLNALTNHLTRKKFNPFLIILIDSYRARTSGDYKISYRVLDTNYARIQRAKKKIEIMKTRIDRKNTWENIIFEGGRVTIEGDSLKIYHVENPEKETIQEIKSNAFRWSSNWGCWYRKHTDNAIYSLNYLSFINSKIAA